MANYWKLASDRLCVLPKWTLASHNCVCAGPTWHIHRDSVCTGTTWHMHRDSVCTDSLCLMMLWEPPSEAWQPEGELRNIYNWCAKKLHKTFITCPFIYNGTCTCAYICGWLGGGGECVCVCVCAVCMFVCVRVCVDHNWWLVTAANVHQKTLANQSFSYVCLSMKTQNTDYSTNRY